ncbi:MAG: TetR/AcrR family transcriptional regulator [Acidobacteriota bacterium]|nr:TetR/AcrR family transcriptional regulator [Acidobacteriota bacterium]
MRAAVLDAAADELLERGFERLSVTAVARRAGVHHTTVYRRWPSKTALLLDAAIELTRRQLPAPDLGDLRLDLRAYFGALAGALADPRINAMVRGQIAAGGPGPSAERERYWQERFGVVAEIAGRAIARGELSGDVEPWRLAELIAGPIWMRALLTGLPIDDAFLGRAIGDALRALA